MTRLSTISLGFGHLIAAIEDLTPPVCGLAHETSM